MAKHRIIIQKYSAPDEKNYERTESIYEQTVDYDIELMPIIVAINSQKPVSDKTL